jgi:hypothetical protein
MMESDVDIETFGASLKSFTDGVFDAVDCIKAPASGFRITEIEIAIEVSAQGSLKLLGSGVEAGGKAGLVLHVSRGDGK